MRSPPQVYGLVSRVKCKLAKRNLQGYGLRPGLSDVCRADGHLNLDLRFRTRCLSNFGEYGGGAGDGGCYGRNSRGTMPDIRVHGKAMLHRR